MKAEELFEASKSRAGMLSISSGLPVRIHYALRRSARFGDGISRDGISQDKVYSAVEDGTIWCVRNIGIKSVKVICDWLCNEQTGSTEGEQKPEQAAVDGKQAGSEEGE